MTTMGVVGLGVEGGWGLSCGSGEVSEGSSWGTVSLDTYGVE